VDAVLAGEASPAEREELDRLSAADPTIRERMASGAALLSTLRRVRTVEPPPELRGSILAAVRSEAARGTEKGSRERSAPGSEDPDVFMGRWARWFNPKRRRSQMSNKKWILGAAVVVAAVIAFVALRNPNRQSNAEGTIGAAHRYQSQQVSGSDVSLDNPQVASFLQSDAFRKLAANPAFRAAAKSDAFARVIGSEELRMASAKYNMAKILEDAHVQELLKNEAFMKAMTDARIGEGLKQADLAHLLDAAHLPDLLKLDAVRQLALKGDFVRLAGDAARAGVSNAADLAKLDSYKTLKDDAAYKTLEGNKYYTEALQYGFLDLFRTPEGAAFAVEGLRQLSESAHLAEALKVEGFSAVMDGLKTENYSAVSELARTPEMLTVFSDAAYFEAAKNPELSLVANAGLEGALAKVPE